jgi:hypothetical protein
MIELKKLRNLGKNTILCCSTGNLATMIYKNAFYFEFVLFRKTIPAEEQEKIYAEVHSQLQQQELKRKIRKRRGPNNEQ